MKSGHAKTDPAGSFKSEALAGISDFLALLVPVFAFGTMFGAASSAAGHSVGISVWSSVAIFAGASQFVFVDVYSLGVPAWSVLLAVFAVNFRHILYSAAITGKIRHFSFFKKATGLFLMTDLQFAAVEDRYQRHEGRREITPAYYFSFGLLGYAVWIVATLIGALSGRLIEDPTVIGLDFVLPIYFLSILMGFRKRPNFLPVVIVSSVVAVFVQKTIGAPWHISLGALAGIAAAVISSIIRHGFGETESIDERMSRD